MAKAVMVQGTGSGAGKSLITAALCRIFRDKGLSVAPFKAQNMALNSAITMDGGEIGRAQALQAEAAGIEPTTDMNPILLKASGDMGSQVIVQGKVHASMRAQEYYAFKNEAWKAVKESYRRLSRKYDVIVMEGAGSPAEINLLNVDIVNMAAAKLAKAPVLLVGDIDKGGVFASLYGTVKLLGRDGKHIRAIIINKFRGDMEILRPGLDMIRDKTGKPVIGVLPYLREIGLPEEDGLALERSTLNAVRRAELGTVKIVVVRLRSISNFTDFDPLDREPDVELVYSQNPAEIETADMVIIPGSKNTVKDLLFLRERGLDESIKRAHAKGVRIMGMCGGYQMLGRTIHDPHGVESPHRKTEGLGLLDIDTFFGREKITCRVEAELLDGSLFPARGPGKKSSDHELSAVSSELLKGYEIHMGESRGAVGLFRVKRFVAKAERRTTRVKRLMDGSGDSACWGTYLHGIFDNDLFRRCIINSLREQKELLPLESLVSYNELRDNALDTLAAAVKESVDMSFIERIMGL